jgi:hypothetical protein
MNRNWDNHTRRYVPKSRVELAKEQRDIALQNLERAARELGRRQQELLDAQTDAKPCICKPRSCNVCGGKK